MKIPNQIGLAIGGYTGAFLCDVYVDCMMILNATLSPIGYFFLVVRWVVNPVAIYLTIKRQQVARTMLYLVTAMGILWPRYIADWLHAADGDVVAIICVALMLRFGSLFLAIRQPVSAQWFGTAPAAVGANRAGRSKETRGIILLKVASGILLAVGLACFGSGTPLAGCLQAGIVLISVGIALSVIAIMKGRKT